MSDKDTIFEVLNKIYGNFFGEESVKHMSQMISDRLGLDDLTNLDDLRNYIWAWYPGGTTAEYAAEKLIEALPEHFRSEA